ncbi:High cysteine protein [Giardia duodenalis]|uniref:High cysteine protein n=1 Tax=Giardia intestinalis (strain ATCC 50803 / WB clone C6) TaxID=184922 RepID=A8BY19_GIAIC|nr:uncharacterized protein GL50803_00d117440 [Giardia intestinalis]XP_001704259.1 High cysteine protein [Giardia intestinalis]KAE8304825.1 High cysteine protein [Giardia intestinalis]KAE8304826.1 High cysteine protein [Giardia intestinalis]|eukprot:XP_001703955.1 Hypothetical protein GL50803_117441 [Giardia lamblia ATCC 50803]
MGGCYNKDAHPGSDICTAAKDGVCTACKADNGLFKNPAAPSEKGSECILCHDATGANGYKGVANCIQCQAPQSAGAATCTACQDGYYKNSQTCERCDEACLTCETDAAHCTFCKAGKYLDGDQCADICGSGNDKYADEATRTCKACSTITGCTACEYNPVTKKPKCTACSDKKVKTELDGTTTCVDANGCATDNVDGSHFLNQARNKCLLCSDDKTNTSSPPNKGLKDCGRCKKERDDAASTCSECLSGFYLEDACKTCDANCAVCSEKTLVDKCKISMQE